MDFAVASDSRRALSLVHNTIGAIHQFTGDSDRAGVEHALAREAAPDPMYRAVADMALGGYLANAGKFEAARELVEAALLFAEEQGHTGFVLVQRGAKAILMMAEGHLTQGMDDLEAIQRELKELGSLGFATATRMNVATIYARIATGEGMAGGGKLGTIMRNPGFALGRARRASQTAYDEFADLSANLPPDLEGLRFNIEFEFAKLLIKRKERDEARKHIEKAIAFLQPMGDCQGMRNARALLATLDQK